MSKKPPEPCPCGSGQTYHQCCGVYHGGVPAPDAERLMRSRYSAYAKGLEAYLLATWHPSTRPANLDLAAEPRAKWIGLAVHAHHQQDAQHATVHFVARCRIGGRAERMEEISEFVKFESRWFYLAASTQ